ncbi:MULTISPECIES: DNA-binding domain-containing protein [unclassified Beijerinckia]|uniref:HvfC/BufC N-terminal domain-containing protein n=1 Tax=unclassified Beijerinckia TaxID=2638183 RepID=UPI00089A71D4|nr:MULTISPECIES: DNA-binding domain-containing protein [unclassified Beijerinckia]MDH7795315.1 hypothetical protein [Beijerinckia sp. GAS462]SEB96462.1 Putative DNA-binding domain-containing protein [Beijerinckia sp. 28-YEA-48]
MLSESSSYNQGARPPSYTAAFAASLLDPAAQAPAILKGSGEIGVTHRYTIYRNNVTVSLIEALAAIYPAVQRMTGTDFFRAMARSHVRSSPPRSPLLFEYGRDFPAFIEQYEYARPLPYLADVARIERAWLDAYHAADIDPLQPSVFASLPSDKLADLILTPHPATRIIRSGYPSITLFSAHRTERDPPALLDTAAPEDALVTRPGLDVLVQYLPPGQSTFLGSLITGHPLGEAAAAALRTSSTFDIATGIAGMIEAGAFCAIRVGETP